MWSKTANFYRGAPILNNVPSRIDPYHTDYLYLWYFSRFCLEYKKFPLINTVLTTDSLNQIFLKWGKTAHFYGGAPILNNVPSRIDPIYTDYLYLVYFLRFCSEYKKFPLINTVFKNDSLNHSFWNWGKTAHFHGGAPILNILTSFFQCIFTHFPILRYFSGF